MKKIKILFSLLILFANFQASAQEKTINNRTTIEVEILKNGALEKRSDI
ncbi:hypothetical protein [Flavobacterium noncentrifugens]|uniref:Uncharacterized protein n=1 Tax=Flavobacterium noncentrifugens TaxID=1128970 RepID=A0A1G9DCM3_9FLAO|nr:hypothetical protein [Flavobacterium noncentrifugens]SDK61544.1 hypothetical protein SAMN04487935_3777 [Flavobacterium noncentrifugens]